MKIFLVGLPGCGKSTLGRQLARLMETDFLDLDQEIEQLVRMPISEVFQRQGEAYFRELERDVLDKCIHQQQDFVMATGGGTPCFHQNIDTINAAGITIFINIPAKVIIGRLSRKGIMDRPLFRDLDEKDMVTAFEKKFSNRMPCYKQAKIEISGDYVTPERIMHLISLHQSEASKN